MNGKRSWMVGGAALAIVLGVALVAHATVNAGIAGWWLFNESYGITAHDASGGGNDGTLVSTAVFAQDPTRGNVLFINGASGEVDFPDSNAFRPQVGTISVWVNPQENRLADIVRMPTNLLINCNRSGDFYAYGLRVTDKGTPVAILANDSLKTCGRKPQIVLNGSARMVKPGQWTHLVMRWDGSTLSLFANGKLAGSTPYEANADSGLSYHGSSPFKVGAALWDMNAGYLEYFGMVSDLRVFSRALSDAEVQSIFNGE